MRKNKTLGFGLFLLLLFAKSVTVLAMFEKDIEPTDNILFIVSKGTQEINQDEFKERLDLVNIIIPKSVEHISKGAFANCVNLESVVFEEDSKLKTIDVDSFQSCSRLKTINIPEGVTEIKLCAFFGCKNLSRVSFLPNVEVIESNAFYDTKISWVRLPYFCKYMATQHDFLHKESFPEGCIVVGGVACNLYD